MATTAKKTAPKTKPSPTKAAAAAPGVKAKAAAPVKQATAKATPAAKAKATVTKAAPARPAAKPATKANVKAAAKPAPAPAKSKSAPAAKKPAAKPATVQPQASAPAKSPPKASGKAGAKETPAAAAKAPPKSTSPTMKTAASKTSKKPAVKAVTGVPANEKELLAMREDDYMNEAQLTFFRNKLLGMREEILDNARETGEHLKENEVFADPNDRATVEEENMLEQRVRDRERKLLKKINASLARIEDGSYGYCLETGEPIGLPRLLARPTAELSIEAQEKHERLEKLFAD